MSFTTPCFIRNNTPELRKKLEELGYKKDCHLPVDIDSSSIGVCTEEDGTFNSITDSAFPFLDKIDCGTNEPLFLAIAALRDDSDYMQWFVRGNKWMLYQREEIHHPRTYRTL